LLAHVWVWHVRQEPQQKDDGELDQVDPVARVGRFIDEGIGADIGQCDDEEGGDRDQFDRDEQVQEHIAQAEARAVASDKEKAELRDEG
jgi:hypothetical protein